MPDQYIKLPDGSYAKFPDTMSDAEIQSALIKGGMVSAPKMPTAPPESMVDKAVDLLPTAGATVGGVVGGIGGTAFGVGFGGVPGAIGGAALGGGSGEAIKQLINRARGKDTPDTSMQAAQDIGTTAAEQGALEALGQTVLPVAGKLATAAYRGYLKPSLAKVSIGDAQKIVQTALDEALPITKGGGEEAARRIGDLNAKVKGILARSGGKVDLAQVANDVRDWAKQQFFKPGAPPQDFEAAMRVADTIDKHPSLGLPPNVTPTRLSVPAAQAYEAKTALQKSVGEGYGTESTATLEARKQGAYLARLATEAAVKPEDIAPLTQRESKLIDTAQAINRAVEREANQYVTHGTKTVLAGLGAIEEYKRTGDPWSAAALGLGARLAMTPAAISRAAILASRLSKVAPGYSPAAVARVAYAALQASEDQRGQ